MLRVLQASAWYPPAHLGGTETYVAGLVDALRVHRVLSRVIAPIAADTADYEFEDTTVRTYPVNAVPSRAELRRTAEHEGFSRFREILGEERPDIYHQHSWTRGLGGFHLQAAHEAGLKTVLTVHIPNLVCMRGTMMRFGEEVCDGRIDSARCAACWSSQRGAHRLVSHLLGAIPPAAAHALDRLGSVRHGRIGTALGARALAEGVKREFMQMAAHADRVVAVCQWLLDALRLNGVPPEKLILNRQGVDAFLADGPAATAPPSTRNGVFRLLYLGRWHPVKGIDVIVRAFHQIPGDAPLTLCIHGIGGGAEENAYERDVRQLAKGDPRITISPPVKREQLPDLLAQVDAIVVPSLWLETGPLVVLEAKAAGRPVIGSRLGGIAELVREPEDGILLPPGNVTAWAEALKILAANRPAWNANRHRTPVRTMNDVAGEMAALYRSLY